jgi:hypothetical protein
MMFGSKARLLVDLIRRSDHANKEEILESFSEFRGMSKRNVFAHSYVWSDHSTVKFMDRQTGGEYKAKEHTFTLTQFRHHVLKVAQVAERFYQAIGATRKAPSAVGAVGGSCERRPRNIRERGRCRRNR